MTSKERMLQTIEFRNMGEEIPQDIWVLPWIEMNYPEEMKEILECHPSDIITVEDCKYVKEPYISGNAYKIGTYVDEWGCIFENLQEGIIGEVKEPIVSVEDEDWEDISNIHIPEELLSFDVKQVNEWCQRHPDKFIKANCCPRPFEQLQFIRGTEELYVDLIQQPKGMMNFVKKMHKFYCELLTKWCQTDVDAVMFMDDWGSQRSLLINPILWRNLFKPLYKDYITIAKKYGKKTMMHSDGYIVDIIPDLIEIGLDILNCQVFCMGMENLKQFVGKITFWGEVDRQWLLPKGSTEEIEQAVVSLRENLFQKGGLIMQLEAGPGANIKNIKTVFETNERLNQVT